ncbi:uncharacterized protein LOC125206851 [Salvia hispanica]|uniref:uncharacterized protein LOC125206851 n=1 Tax=Salvia hispanica TaxID=49212 RepID=UPI0020095108|nr:uncharacterized protein LOC125206851 [Salvia hispanica]
MDDFVNSQNWQLPPTPDPNATPSPGLPTNMDMESPVSTDEYEINDMEPAQGRGKGKGKVADEDGPKKYSPQETMWLAKNFVDVSEDAVIRQPANRQSVLATDCRELRKHWGRVQAEMNKWNGKWTNVVRMWPSGHIEMDLVDKAKEDFFADGKKHFKYFDVWKPVEKSPKYTGGVEAATKRTKVSTAGHYSSSEGGPPIDLNVTDDDFFLSSPGTQSRPIGTKAAKRKTKRKATASYSAMPPPPPPILHGQDIRLYVEYEYYVADGPADGVDIEGYLVNVGVRARIAP